MEPPSSVLLETTIVRYVTFGAALAMAMGLLLYQYYVKFMISRGDVSALTYLVLPIYNMVLLIDVLASVAGIIVTSTNAFTLYHSLLIPYTIYTINSLVIIHMQQLPASAVEMFEVVVITTAISVAAVIADIIIVNRDEFYVFTALCAVAMIIAASLPFRKNPRTHKNRVADAHVVLIEIWIATTVVLNYFNNFDPDSKVLIHGPIVRSCVWFASAITSIWLMFRDTAYWRSLTELSSSGSEHNPDEEVKNADESEHGQSLGPTLMGAFRQAHASVFIDFGLLSVKQKIASGGRSEVFLGTYRGEKVALKVFRPKQITDLMVRGRK
jgi:hypothetical protein